MPELFTRNHLIRFRIFTYICKRQADLILCVSHATKKDVLSYMHSPEEKVKVVYPGANPMFSPIKDEDGIQDTMQKYHVDSDYILCLSTVEPRKNMLRMIQAFEQCLNKVPHKLVIAGGSGWNNGEIYDYVQSKPDLRKRVIFTGYITNEEVKHIYSNASLFVYASLFEGFGLPILEAMQSGIPVITSSVSSMPEVAGDACELVNPLNIEEIENAMLYILSSEKTRASMIKLGLEQSKKFSWEKCAREVLDYILHM